MIAAFFIILSCASAEKNNQSYAEKNGWVEIKPPRLDLQCWRLYGSAHVVCANSLNSTHGAFNGIH